MNGWLYDKLTATTQRKLIGPIRAEPIASLRGDIVELGAGTGASFAYYTSSAHVRALEPNPSMLLRAQQRLKLAQARIELVHADDTWSDTQPPTVADHVVSLRHHSRRVSS